MYKFEEIMKKFRSLNVSKETRAEVHKVSERKYAYAIILNFNDPNVYNFSKGHTLVSGMELSDAEELASMINEEITLISK